MALDLTTPVQLINSTEFSGVIKRLYSNYREKFFPISDPIVAQLRKGKGAGPGNVRWGGEGVRFGAVMGRPLGVVANSSGVFGYSHTQAEKQGQIDIRRVYVTRTIDGLAAYGTTDKKAAYIAIATKLTEEAMDATTLFMSEAIHGDGRGIKATVTVAGTGSGGSPITVANPYGITGAGQGGLLLDVGMQVAFLDSTGATILHRAAITSVTNTGDNCVLTLDVAAGVAVALNSLVVSATRASASVDPAIATSYNQHPHGLAQIMNRLGAYPVLHGIDASQADSRRWTSTALTATGIGANVASCQEMDIWELLTAVEARSGKSPKLNPNDFLLATTPGIERQIGDNLLSQRRFMTDTKQTLQGGYMAVTVCGLPLVSSGWAVSGEVKLIHKPSILFVDGKDWGMVEMNDSASYRPIEGRDAFEFTFGSYMNIGAVSRISHGLLTGYTDTRRYSPVI